MPWRLCTLAMCAMLLVGASAGAGSAQECQVKAVHARGQPGLVEAIAKSRARSAWIKKVRQDRHLGPSYAAWLRAKNPTYACRRTGKRRICEASANPCHVEGALPTARPVTRH